MRTVLTTPYQTPSAGGYIHVAREPESRIHYEIAWDRHLPYFDQLTVGMFRPGHSRISRKARSRS